MADSAGILTEIAPTRVTRRRNVTLALGLIGLCTIVAIAVFAPFLTSHDPYAQDITNRIAPPIWHAFTNHDPRATWAHPLGTDKLGRDYWTRIIYGGRISLLIGASAVVISGFIGTAMGVIAGYRGGMADHIVNLAISIRLSVPIIMVALAIVSIYQSSLGVVIAVLGLLLWDRFAVVSRAATLQVRSNDYVSAAKAAGCSNLRIIVGEILPNISDSLIVVAAVEMAHAILLEASLSFLGLGVKPPLPSWGLMLADAKDDIFFLPWMITLPGLAIFLLVLSITLVGEGLRSVVSGRG